ncbi:MAG TPA: SDR family oxidoreductase [Sphingomonas sp.]
MSRSDNLKGKKALVTGGSRGIGSAIAKRLAADGAEVAITYAGNKAAADATVAAIEQAGGKAVAIQANAADDASQRAGIAAAVEALGRIDILVHNAGVAEFATVDQDTDESFERQFGVNVRGLHVGTRAALAHIPDGGRIILIGSIAGEGAAFPGIATYGATKAAVAGLGRGWAKDLAARRILVNVIQPGPIATDMAPGGDVGDMLKQSVPLGRFGEPEEIAGVASFLAGPDAAFITGATLNVDGGFTI